MSEAPKLDTEFVRAQFPAMETGWTFLENAGGTVAARQVIDRVGNYMSRFHVQPLHAYEVAEEAGRLMAESQTLMAEMIGAAPEEVMVGPNTTTNVFLLMHAIRGWFKPGDEVIVTNIDHEANNGAWRRLEEFGMVIREWRFRPETGGLVAEDLDALLNDKTRLVCFTHCSNLTGTVNDVPALVRRIHDAGALACVDGVAYTPHRALDVKAWDVDFYLCSLYKVYGPHLSLLYAKREHVERAANNNHYFLADKLPLKLNPGGPNHELTASLAGVTDYFDTLHRHHYGESNLPRLGRMKQVADLMSAHEEVIAQPFVDFLLSRPDVTLLGSARASHEERAPTFSFVVKDRAPLDICKALADRKIGVGTGNFYAARGVDALGYGEEGVIRASMVHYNTADEVTRLIEALDAAI